MARKERKDNRRHFLNNKQSILRTYGDKPVTVHKNSSGGYVITAHETPEGQNRFVSKLTEDQRAGAYKYKPNYQESPSRVIITTERKTKSLDDEIRKALGF